jgi:hypothetical protein
MRVVRVAEVIIAAVHQRANVERRVAGTDDSFAAAAGHGQPRQPFRMELFFDPGRLQVQQRFRCSGDIDIADFLPWKDIGQNAGPSNTFLPSFSMHREIPASLIQYGEPLPGSTPEYAAARRP